MDVVLRLDAEQEARLVDAAEQAGRPVEAFAVELIDDVLGWSAKRSALLSRLLEEDGEVLRRLGET